MPSANPDSGTSPGREAGQRRLARFIANGVVATSVNLLTLVLLLEVVGLRSAGAAALLAAVAGITVSYMGNRRFVFESRGSILPELFRFKLLYAGTALFYAAFMAAWTDWLGLPYLPGFVVATAACACLSYLGSRAFVYRP